MKNLKTELLDRMSDVTAKTPKHVFALIKARMDEYKIPEEAKHRNFIFENIILSLLVACIETAMNNNPILDRAHVMQNYVERTFELMDFHKKNRKQH